MLYMKDLLEKEQLELSHLVDDLKAQLFTFHFKNSTGQQDQTHKIKLIRRDIARVLMAISMKQQIEGKKKISTSKKKTKKTYSLTTKKVPTTKETSSAKEVKVESSEKLNISKETTINNKVKTDEVKTVKGDK